MYIAHHIIYILNFRMLFKYGLKAQKLLAQGIALGLPFPSAGDRWFRACGAYMRNIIQSLLWCG